MRKTLAILLAFILTFSCVSLLSTGVAVAATQEMGVNLIESDFHKPVYNSKDKENTSMWQGTNGSVTYLDDNSDGTTDFARIAAVSGKTGSFYSPTAMLYPGNSYELSFYLRVPKDIVTEDFAAYPSNDKTVQLAPKFAIYQPTNTQAGQRVSSTYGEGEDDYAYKNKRRTDFSYVLTVGDYAPYTKTNYSILGSQQHYAACKDENGNSVSPNVVYEDWTKVTMTFTAIDDAENQGPQVVAVCAEITKSAVGLCYDIKDFSLVCTDNGTVAKTIMTSDFDNADNTNWQGSKQNVQFLSEDDVSFARVNSTTSKGSGLLSPVFNLVPGNEYELNFDFRIPKELSKSYMVNGKTFYAPNFFIYEPKVGSSGVKVASTPQIATTSNANNLYAYSYTDKVTDDEDGDTSFKRRPSFKAEWQVGSFGTITKEKYSHLAYSDHKKIIGDTTDAAEAYSEWTSVTVKFTAIEDEDGERSQTAALGFTFHELGIEGYIFDVKDVSLTETASKITPEPDTTDMVYYEGFESSPNPTDIVTVYSGANVNLDWVEPKIISTDASTGTKAYSAYAMYQNLFIPFDKSKLASNTVYSFSIDWMLKEYTQDKQRRIENIYVVGYTPTDGVTFKNGYEALAGKGETKGTGNWETTSFNFRIPEDKFNKYEQFGICIAYRTSGTNSSDEDRICLDTITLKVSENQDIVNPLELNEAPRTENTIKVLAFGNSFSNDGTSFIPQIAYADGVDLRVADCSIGGCSLKKHYEKSVTNDPAYSFYYRTPQEKNPYSKSVGSVTMSQALAASDWDYITIQQVSTDSGKPDSFEPYLGKLIEKFKEYCPNAKIVFQMTWAYRDDLVKSGYEYYNNDQETMYNAIIDTYLEYAEKYDVEFIIPSGETIQTLRGLKSDTLFTTEFNATEEEIAAGANADKGDFTRDGYHLSQKGRVAAAFTWYEIFTGISALDTKIDLTTSAYGTLAGTYDTLIGITAEEALAIKTAAHNAASTYKKAIETTKAIKAIGTVDANSGEAIENAKALRAELNNDDLIVNLQTLLDAIAAFENFGSSDEVLGDFDGTGEADLEDVALLAQYFAGWEGVNLDDAKLDISGDGNVNLYDLVKLAQIVAKWPN